MNFKLIGAFVRIATFEVVNDNVYISKLPYSIELNGITVAEN